MDKNTITGLILIALIILGFNYYVSTSNVEVAQKEVVKKTKVTSPTATKAISNIAASTIDTTDVFYTHFAKENNNEVAVLKNNKIKLEISKKGAYISRAQLLGFRSYENFHENKEIPLLLFDNTTHDFSFQFETLNGIYRTNNYLFDVISQTDSSVVMALPSINGDTLKIAYTLLPDNYIVNTEISEVGKYFKGNQLQFNWTDKIRKQEKGFYFENMYSTLTYRDVEGDTKKLNEYKDDSANPENPVNWIAYKNQYFSSVLIAGNRPFNHVKLNSDTCSENSGFIKSYASDLQIDYKPNSSEPLLLQYYFGPNKYRLLQSMEQYRLCKEPLSLETLVYLGWPIFKWINRFFTIYVFDFLTRFGMNMGIVLLLITILLRIIVYPAARKSYLSSARMKVLKPKIDAIAVKYPNKEDAMKRQQETMMLYSQYGVSPMGGCLPMLIQMPIWIAMFNFIPNAFELRQQSFLWADDLSTYDSLIQFNNSYWLIGDHLSLFCILFCGTNLLYSWIMMKQQQSGFSAEQQEQMKVMRWMTFLMPIFFFFMFNKYSSGLNYYYFISLLAGALTMWYLRKSTDEERLLRKLEENYKKNKDNPQKQSGFAARLQAYQKLQEEELKRRREQRNK